MKLPHPTWLFLLCAAASLPAPAEIYRWTDADGRVHYGDRAPGSGAERIEAAPGTLTPDPELARHREQTRKLIEVWDAERRERHAAAAQAAERDAERAQACASLRAELEQLRRSAYVVRESAEGSREILGSAEREQYERQVAQAIAAHCT